MNVFLATDEDAGKTISASPKSSCVPAAHPDDAAGTHYADPLVTLCITAQPDQLTSGAERPPNLAPSVPDTHTAIVTAFLSGGGGGGGTASGAGAASAAVWPTQPSLRVLSNSVRSSELNRLLLAHTPLSSPRQSQGDGVPDENSPQRSSHRYPAAYGASQSWGNEPSLSHFSQNPPDSELVSATTDPLASMLHSTAVAIYPQVPRLRSASASSGEEPRSVVEARCSTGPTPLEFVTDLEPITVVDARSGSSTPPTQSDAHLVQKGEMAASPGSATGLVREAPGTANGASQQVLSNEGVTKEDGGKVHSRLPCTSLPVPLTHDTASPLRQPATLPSSSSMKAAACAAANPTSATSPAASPPRPAGQPISATSPPSAAASAPACLPPPSTNLSRNLSTTHSLSLPASASTAATRLTHAKPPSRITAWIRSRVSQNKVRFREGDFNLDLTYITPHIIAMGYPAHGTEYYIRNPIDEVERFFCQRHPGHYRIYNLCSERVYDNPRRFDGCFRRFPFDDHNVPSLALMLEFVLDAATFLDADEANVVAIHCKAGKGRTGVMVSCLLFYLYPDRFATANEAIHFFDQQRTCDGEGMTIPSQRRYVHYFETLVRDFHGSLPPTPRRLALKEVIVRVARESTILHPGDLYFIIYDHQQTLLDSRMWFPHGPTISSAGCVFAFASLKADAVPAPLVGDVKFAFFRRRPIVLAGKESTACYLWFNTTLCHSLKMVYQRTELDKVDVATVGKNVMVALSFAEVADTLKEKDAALLAPLPEDSAA